MKRGTVIRIAVWSAAAILVGTIYWQAWSLIGPFEEERKSGKFRDGRLPAVTQEELDKSRERLKLGQTGTASAPSGK